MKHIEVSRRIKLTRDVTEDDLKQSLIERLRRCFDVDSITEVDGGFRIKCASGGADSITRSASVDLNVKINKQNEIARIIICGTTKTARSLMIWYVGLFVMVLLVGLLPGSIETSADTSDASDALVLLLFGAFIFYDISKKVDEPQQAVEAILKSLDTEFG